jgi:hypothetical protein
MPVWPPAGCFSPDAAVRSAAIPTKTPTVDFKSGGKAFTSLNGMSSTCTYKQESKTVTLECEGDKTVFTMNNDGSLGGPPNGFLARLTKKEV